MATIGTGRANGSCSLLHAAGIGYGASLALDLKVIVRLLDAPCRKEIPELNELASHHKEKLMVVGVNFDGSKGELLENEIQKLGIEFSSLIDDPRNVWGLEPVSVLPETLIIGPDGKLQHRLIGPQTLSSIEALL